MAHWLKEGGDRRSQDGTLAQGGGSIEVTRWSTGSLRWVDHGSQDGPLAQ